MDERDPVDDGEWVYRRIHRVFYVSSTPIAVQFPAFRPNQNDVSGISVFRAALVQAADILPAAKVNEYYVARLRVADLTKLGLSVVPEPIPQGPPGHSVIPQLSWQSYHADKTRCKLILLELAKLASAGIVHRPA